MDTGNSKLVEPPGNDETTDIEFIYKESCEIARHYSVAIRNIRTLAVVQGLAALSAVIYVYSRYIELGIFSPFTLSAISVFGTGVTLLMWYLHYNYLDNFRVAEKQVIYIENSYFSRFKPWTEQSKARKTRWRGIRGKMINYAIYVLLLGTLVFTGALPWTPIMSDIQSGGHVNMPPKAGQVK